MERRKTRAVQVGTVTIGGGAPVSVQSMTKTYTEHLSETLRQIGELAEIGCEIIRCAVADARAVEAIETIARKSPVPVIADCHFDHRLALGALAAGVHGVRLNPGNMSDQEGLRQVFREAASAGRKVRIGVNSGSIRARKGMDVETDAEELARLMVRETLECCELAEGQGCRNLVLSLKASDVPTTIRAYRMAAAACDYPLHLGVTAAGPPALSLVKSAIGIGTLLAEGIGDTIRVSMTGPPHAEVDAAYSILRALELRAPDGPEIISCPTCGRCTLDLPALVAQVQERLKGSRKNVKVAIMGCIVNGPGEAAEADVGIAGGKDFGYVFRSGKKIKKVAADSLADALIAEMDSMD